MSDIAITAVGLGKRYQLGQFHQTYKSLRESIMSLGAAALGRNEDSSRRKRKTEFIWALRDISLEIKQGEVLGIIGPNGAGKTTLLKILARITYPTVGEATIYGRVGSLLEVGTGFHPELTGRENIFLSGAILGMRHAEITRKLDEIVAFSGVEKFLDTPVKRFSSGMQVRLAFSVAAHLQPEILLIDEVLAVGDAEFQRKCLGRMETISQLGRTVLFVSHNMASVAQLCQRALLLDHGKIVDQGDVRSMIERYLSTGAANQAEIEFPDIPSKPIQVRKLRILDDQGKPASVLDCSKSFQMVIEVDCRETASGTMHLFIETAEHVRVCHSICANAIKEYTRFVKGKRLQFVARFPGGLLNERSYTFVAGVTPPGDLGPYDVVISPTFRLEALTGSSPFAGERKKRPDILRVAMDWDVMEI